MKLILWRRLIQPDLTNFLPSAPHEWREATDRLDPTAFTINTMLKRLQQKGEIWENILKKKAIITNSRSFFRVPVACKIRTLQLLPQILHVAVCSPLHFCQSKLKLS